MADNDNFDSFLDELDKIGRRLEAARGSPDSTRPDFEKSTPETPRDAARENGSLKDDRIICTSSFSEEHRVGPPPAELFITKGCRRYFDIPPSVFNVKTHPSYSEFSEDNPEKCNLIPVEASRGDFGRTDANQSSSPEYRSSSLQISKCIDSSSKSHEKRSNHVMGASDSSKEKNEEIEFFQKRKHFDSTSTPKISIELDRNSVKVQKLEHHREMASADGNGKNDSSESVTLGSVVDGEGVTLPGPSGTQKKPHRTGKMKSFVCGFCGKAIKGRYELEAHERTHTGERPFACKTFTQQGSLTTHLLTHTLERPFECKECDKTFKLKGNLTRHLITHTRDKTIACEFFERRFAGKQTLASHVLTHAGEKPFECVECGSRFSRSSSCRRHLEQVHGRK